MDRCEFNAGLVHTPTPKAVREQFDRQAPYFPGTFWLVDGYPVMIDSVGRACTTSGVPLRRAFYAHPEHHTIRRLHLVLA